MKQNPNRRRAPYKAEGLLPVIEEPAVRGMRGAPPVGDWNSDPMLKEKPRSPDTDVSSGRTIDAHVEVGSQGEYLSFSETPTMAADERAAEAERHNRRPNAPKTGSTGPGTKRGANPQS